MAYPDIQTESEYRQYQAAVYDGSRDLEALSTGACRACETCNPERIQEETWDGTAAGEGEFSWSPCEICSRYLGGTRYPAHYLASGELVHLRVCADCLYYLEYGQLDDETMSRLEDA